MLVFFGHRTNLGGLVHYADTREHDRPRPVPLLPDANGITCWHDWGRGDTPGARDLVASLLHVLGPLVRRLSLDPAEILRAVCEDLPEYHWSLVFDAVITVRHFDAHHRLPADPTGKEGGPL